MQETTNIKVCFFIGTLSSGGAERVTVNLANYLSESDYEVCIITLDSLDNDFYKISPKVRRISLDLDGHNFGLKKLSANYKRLRNLRNLLKEIKPNVVIGMMTTESVLTILACLGTPAKCIVSERNSPERTTTSKPWLILRKIVYKYADAHVVQTNQSYDWLIKQFKVKKIRKIANPVDWPLDRFSPIIDPNSSVYNEKHLILAIGKKYHQKGFDLLMESFSLISKNHSKWMIAIVGINENDSDYSKILSLADMLNIRDKLILPGRVGNIGDWYSMAEIFVLSSRYEGFPNALIEAMSSGTVVVAFDCDTGPEDIIQHGVNGFLVESENINELTNTISELICNPELRLKLSKNAQLISSEYSIEKIGASWKDLISTILYDR